MESPIVGAVDLYYNFLKGVTRSIRKKELKKNEFPATWNFYDDDIINGRPVNKTVSVFDNAYYFVDSKTNC